MARGFGAHVHRANRDLEVPVEPSKSAVADNKAGEDAHACPATGLIDARAKVEITASCLRRR